MTAYKGSILMVCHEPDFYEDWATDVWDVSQWTTKEFKLQVWKKDYISNM